MKRLVLAGTACALLSIKPAVGQTASIAPAPTARPTQSALDDQRYRNSISLHAQLLCSGVFVSNRDPQSVISQDLQWNGYTFHDWGQTQYQIDWERRAISLSAPANDERLATPKYTAVYHDGLGCTLLPADAEQTSYRPPVVKTTLPPADSVAWPMGDLDAFGDGFDHRRMRQALDFAIEGEPNEIPQETRAIVVLHEGRIVGERYRDGFSADTAFMGWSMGKSLSAALLGIMAKEEGWSVDDRAPISDWSRAEDPRHRITFKHLLNMASGLKFFNPSTDDPLYYTDGHDHESVYFRGQNTEQLVLNQPLEYEPGKVFEYRNTNTLALMSAIKRTNLRRGEDHHEWPRTALFDKIGARSVVLETDAFGNFVVTGFDYATARDWARLGQFFLQDGHWQGEQLWPEGWSDVIKTPSSANPEYGGQVWVNL
ncbi:MAG: serine hydrolase, partial [Pseudomonadota bacterium]